MNNRAWLRSTTNRFKVSFLSSKTSLSSLLWIGVRWTDQNSTPITLTSYQLSKVKFNLSRTISSNFSWVPPKTARSNLRKWGFYPQRSFLNLAQSWNLIHLPAKKFQRRHLLRDCREMLIPIFIASHNLFPNLLIISWWGQMKITLTLLGQEIMMMKSISSYLSTQANQTTASCFRVLKCQKSLEIFK